VDFDRVRRRGDAQPAHLELGDGHRDALPHAAGLAMVGGAGPVEDQRKRRLDVDDHLGELAPHQGLVDERPAERMPLPRVTQGFDQGATRVADQIKFLTRFIYLLGGVSSSIAAVDEAARRNEASPTVVQQNQQSKAQVKTSIQGFRETLDKLEIDFRATPELQPYYIKLAGVASGAATAEELAAKNQFDAAGRQLLNVINRLTDVLLLMRTTT